MSASLRCLPVLTVLACVSPSLRAEEPDLKDFKTVETAIKTRVSRTITPPTSTTPAYLGVFLDRNGLGKLEVVHVDPESPAAKAGLRTGDLVTLVEGKALPEPAALRDLVRDRAPGDTMGLAVQRRYGWLRSANTITVTLGAVSSPLSDTGDRSGRGAPRPVIGVSLEAAEGAVKIASLTAGGPAEQAGLKVGDLILKIDGNAATGTDKVADAISARKIGDTVTLIYKRDGKEQQIKVKVAAGQGAGGFDFRRDGYFRKDTYKLAVLPIDFADVKHNDKITPKDWEEALFSKGTYTNRSVTGQQVHGSLNDYYQEISCGKLKVTGKVFEPVAVAKKREEYSTSSPRGSSLLTDVLDALLTRDGAKALDGFDGIFFLYSGGRVQTQRGGLYWPHKSTLSHKGKRWSYFICPEGGRDMASISVIAHEFGHMLGLPDLYARPESPGSEGLGVWCTMATGHGRDGKPLHFSSWCKEKMGWLEPAVIDPTVRQRLILSPIVKSDRECFKVLVKPDGSEYLLLENRTKKGFDRDLPGEGLLIWRVVNDRPVLEESHGILGPNGPGRYLSSVPYPSKSNTAFTPLTTPSSKPLSGSGHAVHITNIRRLPDGRITFFVGFEYF